MSVTTEIQQRFVLESTKSMDLLERLTKHFLKVSKTNGFELQLHTITIEHFNHRLEALVENIEGYEAVKK